MDISAIANRPGEGVSDMRVHVGAGYRCLRSRVAQDKLLRTIEREVGQPHSPL
jgi:putative component of toxin-antitoxin plasmid stabilization module